MTLAGELDHFTNWTIASFLHTADGGLQDSSLTTRTAEGSEHAPLRRVLGRGNNPVQGSSSESGFYKYKSVL